jgi:hypothetical protein
LSKFSMPIIVLQCMFYSLEQAYSSAIQITREGTEEDSNQYFSQLKELALAISTALLFWNPSPEDLAKAWWYDQDLLDKIQAAKDYESLSW